MATPQKLQKRWPPRPQDDDESGGSEDDGPGGTVQTAQALPRPRETPPLFQQPRAATTHPGLARGGSRSRSPEVQRGNSGNVTPTYSGASPTNIMSPTLTGGGISPTFRRSASPMVGTPGVSSPGLSTPTSGTQTQNRSASPIVLPGSSTGSSVQYALPEKSPVSSYASKSPMSPGVGTPKPTSNNISDFMTRGAAAPASREEQKEQKTTSHKVPVMDKKDNRSFAEYTAADVMKYMKRMGKGYDDERRVHAAHKLSNMFADNEQLRGVAHHAGILPQLFRILGGNKHHDKQLRRCATTCVAALAIDTPVKKDIVRIDGLPILIDLLAMKEQSSNARATQGQAVAALWSLCVDEPDFKVLLEEEETLCRIIWLCCSEDEFSAKQACGCLSELCLGDSQHRSNAKDQLHRLGAVQALLACLLRDDEDLQRLAASGLCNLMAHKDNIKRTAINHGIIEAFAKLVKGHECNRALLQSCAAGLFNLATPMEGERYMKLQVVDRLRMIPVSSKIDLRLGLINGQPQPQVLVQRQDSVNVRPGMGGGVYGDGQAPKHARYGGIQKVDSFNSKSSFGSGVSSSYAASRNDDSSSYVSSDGEAPASVRPGDGAGYPIKAFFAIDEVSSQAPIDEDGESNLSSGDEYSGGEEPTPAIQAPPRGTPRSQPTATQHSSHSHHSQHSEGFRGSPPAQPPRYQGGHEYEDEEVPSSAAEMSAKEMMERTPSVTPSTFLTESLAQQYEGFVAYEAASAMGSPRTIAAHDEWQATGKLPSMHTDLTTVQIPNRPPPQIMVQRGGVMSVSSKK